MRVTLKKMRSIAPWAKVKSGTGKVILCEATTDWLRAGLMCSTVKKACLPTASGQPTAAHTPPFGPL